MEPAAAAVTDQQGRGKPEVPEVLVVLAGPVGRVEPAVAVAVAAGAAE